MDSTYVKEMERVVNEGRVIEKDGQTFSSLNMKPVLFQPRSDPLSVRTLTGLAAYILENPDRLVVGNLLIHVRNHGEVAVLSPNGGEDMKRDAYLVAKYDGQVFPFGKWLPSAEFTIALNSLFFNTPAKENLLKFISKLKIEDETNIGDSGVAQSATVRVGVKGGLTENETAPSRPMLAPFRTFTEIEQPESEFVFRMRQSGGEVELALFEADGGAWKSVAADRISAWLFDSIESHEEKDGPVILA